MRCGHIERNDLGTAGYVDRFSVYCEVGFSQKIRFIYS